MIPLSNPLSDAEIAEIVRQARRAKSAMIQMLLTDLTASRGDATKLLVGAGLESDAGGLYRTPEGNPPSCPTYVSYNETDHDALIMRPIAWHDPTAGTQRLVDLLLEIPRLPLGGYALARLGDRDLVLFLNHLPTQYLHESELCGSLVAADLAGGVVGIVPSGDTAAWFERHQSNAVAKRVDELLLSRPTGWMKVPDFGPENYAWVCESTVPISAYYDATHGLLAIVRGVRSFVGKPPLELVDSLLRNNLKMLDGAVTAIRDEAQGAIVILSRLVCDDLDPVELDRAVGYVERIRLTGTQYDGHSALELLEILRRNPVVNPTLHSRRSILSTEPSRAEKLHLGVQASKDELSIPVSNLLTHAFVCGGSGSGKTIVCKNLIEELALAGVPSIVVDLKGDLSSLACVPSDAQADAIAQYLVRLYGPNLPNEHLAEIAQTAQKIESLYVESTIDGITLQDFRESVLYRVLTPRSDDGIPMSLSPLAQLDLDAMDESGGIIGNRTLHELVETNLRSLVEHISLSDGDSDALIAVLTQVLQTAYREGMPLQGIEGIETLVKLLYDVHEHTKQVNFLSTEAAIDETQAKRYARAMNARLGGTFRYWLDGEALSVEELIAESNGRTPINVINLSALPAQRDQAYAIAQINAQIISWMRRQPGAQRPRLLYAIDEIAQDGGKGAIFPPYPRNPITKPGLTVLLKQGRAFGLSCLLATQNAKDIDYKGLGQCDTWIIGRLKTEHDLERLKTGLNAAQADATHQFGDKIEDILARVAGLAPGNFVIKTHSQGVVQYKQKWIRSIHERLTSEMLRNWLRAEELKTEERLREAEKRWANGKSSAAVALLEAIINDEPYFSRIAEVRLHLCEWLFRTKQWSKVAEHSRRLRKTVRSKAGFELVHYYEGMSECEIGHLDAARAALERFLASVSDRSSELAERCRSRLQELFVKQDDYESLEKIVKASENISGRSRILGFCRLMKSALDSWPTLRGGLGDATVLSAEGDNGSDEIRFARKSSRNVSRYVAEIRQRLNDLPLSAPELAALSDEESSQLRRISARILSNVEAQRVREKELNEFLSQANLLIESGDLPGASDWIDSARKLVENGGLPVEGFERTLSLYRGAFSTSRSSVRAWLLNLDPIRFELEAAALFRALGYRADATIPCGDGGVDVLATYENLHFVIQCKQYQQAIGPGQIREFAAAVQNFDADQGIFVTTSRFTDGCREEAERHDIQLIDLEGLIRLYAGMSSRRRTDVRADTQNSSRLESDCHEAVLALLKDAYAPLTIGEITRLSGYARPVCQESVRRIMSEGLVEKTGRGRGTRYTLVSAD